MDTETVSGPGRQLAALAPYLERAGFEQLVVVFQRKGRPSSNYAAFLAARGVNHVVISDWRAFDLSVIARVKAVLHDWQPDIVQTHSYRPTAIAAALRLLGAGWHWIGFYHGATAENRKVRAYHRLDRVLLKLADRIVVMATQQASLFGDSAPVTQIPNAVLAEPPCELPERVRSLLAGIAHPRIGVIGRLSHEKGVDVFLAALRLHMHRHSPVKGLIVGEGPERERLMSLARELGIDEHVHFLGALYPASALYSELDLVVIPSRSEGLPNVLLEALAANRRIVATRVGAIGDVLIDVEAGRMVEAADASALADAIAAALAEPAEVGDAARNRAVARFSLAARRDAHIELYNAVLHRRQPLNGTVGR